MGQGLGGLLGKAGISNPLEKAGGLLGAFDKVAKGARNLNDGQAEYVVQMQKGKNGPTEYYRVDEAKDGTMKARKLESGELTAEIRNEAKTPAQLQKELADANTPAKLNASLKYAQDTDAFIAGKTGRTPEGPLEAGKTPAETRQNVIAELGESLKEIKKIPKSEMPEADKKAFSQTVDGEISRLERIQGIPSALQAAATAANPAVAPAAAPSFPTPGQ